MDMRKGNRVLKILAKFLVAFILVKLVLKREPFIKAGCYRRKEFIFLNYYNRVNTGITESVEATPELKVSRERLWLSAGGGLVPGDTWLGGGVTVVVGRVLLAPLKARDALTTPLCTGQPQQQTTQSKISVVLTLENPELDDRFGISDIDLMLSQQLSYIKKGSQVKKYK